MTCVSTVGVNDDLTTGKTRVTCRTAYNKTTGGVDINLGCIIHHTLGNDRKNNFALDILADLLGGYLIAMLRRNNNGINTNGIAVLVVFNGDLSLAVGTQIFECAVLAHLGQAERQLVRKRNGKRHQLGSLVASVTKHQALVAGTDVELVALTVLGFKRLINTHCNVGRLLVQRDNNRTAIAVKTVFCAVVTDFANGVAYDSLHVNVSASGNLTHYANKTGGAKGFASYARHRVLTQHFVKDGIRNLITDFIGMSLGNRFTCK